MLETVPSTERYFNINPLEKYIYFNINPFKKYSYFTITNPQKYSYFTMSSPKKYNYFTILHPPTKNRRMLPSIPAIKLFPFFYSSILLLFSYIMKYNSPARIPQTAPTITSLT